MNRLNELKIIFAQQLEELMKNKGISITKLSADLGVPRQTISNWLNLRRSPQIDSLELIANYFNVSIDYLFDRDSSNI